MKTISDNLGLMKEWNYKKNVVNPKNISLGTNRKLWWICEKNHEWESTVHHRLRGDGCPYCSNRRVLQGYNDLQTTHPEILNEWDYKNNNILPTQVTGVSIQKVHWICKTCKNEWQARIKDRIKNNSGCPECAKIKRNKTNLSTIIKKRGTIENTDLIVDFDYEANYPLLPSEITKGSNRIINWKCHNSKHTWSAKVNNKTHGRGCPVCSNRVIVVGKNDLQTTHPDIAKEWNYDKNGSITPEQFTYGQNKKVWWLCPEGHEYQATINHRTSGNGTNCPICSSGIQTSFQEQTVFFYIKKYFPKAINRYKPEFLKGMELDIYIPESNIAIEYDGEPWHSQKKLNSEKKKHKLCQQNNIKLFRIKEKNINDDIKETCDTAIYGGNLYKNENFEAVIYEVIRQINLFYYPIYLLKNEINIQKDKNEILKYKHILKKDSLEELYPKIASEWHPIKNNNLNPFMFTPGSNFKAWWICPNCGNEYEASISHRTRGTNCPKCAINRVALSCSKKVEMIDLKTNKVIKTYSSISDAGKNL